MASTPNKVQYFKRGESSWELFYFETSADQIAASETKQISTKAQLNLIDTYLNDFNTAEHLVKLDEDAQIPVDLLPDISATYLRKYGPTFTGTLQGNSASFNHISAYDSPNDTLIIGNRTQDQNAAYITFKDNTEQKGVMEFYADAGFKLSSNNSVIDVDNNWIRNVQRPLKPHEAANKEYVDNKVSSGFTTKTPVKAASVENIDDINIALNSLDGVMLSAQDRVLLKNQTTASENGVYKLDSTKKPVKSSYDSEVGSAVFVEFGETNNDYIYHCSTENSWVAFTKPDTIQPGAGLEKSGTTLSIAENGVKNSMIDSLDPTKLESFEVDDTIATTWTNLPDASTNHFLLNHIASLYTAITLLRGTESYNKNITQTIAGAYSNAATAQTAATNAMAAIPTIGVGKNLPTSGMKAGDLYFLEK